MGNSHNLLPDVHKLVLALAPLGLTLHMPPRRRWHDYSDCDALVAVRPTGGEDGDDVLRKPASKLWNAWLAGVPAVLSAEPAYAELRESELDYLEARDVADIKAQLTVLAKDPALRRKMQERGRERVAELRAERIVEDWAAIFREEVFPRYRRWRGSPTARLQLIVGRSIRDALARAWRRLGLSPRPPSAISG
jgi:hypothetical protein